MKISKKQFDFITNSTYKINIAEGAVRSGKSFCFNIRWLDYIYDSPKGDLAMVGKTVNTLERNVLMATNGLFEILGEGNYTYNSTRGIITIGKRRIYCFGANDERSEAKIRGATFAGAFCDEVTLFPQNFVEQLIARCSVTGAKQFWNCNPDSPFHYIKKEFIDRIETRDIVKVWHFLLDDNPSLSDEYKDGLKKLYSGLFYKRFILGQWVLAQGTIYDMFDENRHVTKVKKDGYDRYIVGVDYGTNNPCVYLLIGIKDDTYYVIKEFHYNGRESGKQKTDLEYTEDFLDFIDGYDITNTYVDPSASSLITQFRRKNIRVIPARNEVIDGITTVANKLHNGELYIDESCTNLIDEFGSYVWDENAQKIGVDKPLKENDHCQDGLRYAIFTDIKVYRKISNRSGYGAMQ